MVTPVASVFACTAYTAMQAALLSALLEKLVQRAEGFAQWCFINEVFKNDVATLVVLLASDSLGHYFTLDNIPMKQETDWSRSRTENSSLSVGSIESMLS